MANPDLFGFKKPRAPRRFLAHMIDVGIGDCIPHDRNLTQIAQFKCHKCGWESDWVWMENVTAVKRGIPCENCNQENKND
ncbi:hypothetical protein FKW31_03165 [Acetobacter sp. DmW_136]|uniref:hypothetical protein n=1 Tax=Acetobacter sp. DmW_136 TaxID=2591091 RepID=UPI0012394DFF|nr:hypothetical protein [Acetobacter sp. DmW_136]KAA8387659.1 hypothetical protein FKW31_03165 [Acetobacter sp. DmW_136]